MARPAAAATNANQTATPPNPGVRSWYQHDFRRQVGRPTTRNWVKCRKTHPANSAVSNWPNSGGSRTPRVPTATTNAARQPATPTCDEISSSPNEEEPSPGCKAQHPVYRRACSSGRHGGTDRGGRFSARSAPRRPAEQQGKQTEHNQNGNRAEAEEAGCHPSRRQRGCANPAGDTGARAASAREHKHRTRPAAAAECGAAWASPPMPIRPCTRAPSPAAARRAAAASQNSQAAR